MKASDITNSATQFFWSSAVGGNDHIYEFVNTDVRWDTALSLAASKTLGGVNGYLVTITSLAEQAFIVSRMNLITVGWDSNEIWIAATDRVAEGVWKWAAGPESGTSVNFLPETGGYGFPTNYKAGADFACLTMNYVGGKCSPSGPVRQTFGLEEWRISGSS